MNKNILSLLLSFILTVFFINKYQIDILFSIILFLLIIVIIRYTLKKYNKKYKKVSFYTSIIMSIIYVICDSVNTNYFIDIFNRSLLLNVMSYFIIFNVIINNTFTLIDKYKKNNKEDKKINIGSKEILSTSKFSFIINFSLITIIYVLFLLRLYPGNLTFDSYNEIKQTLNILPLMNNHSIIHTLLLKAFVSFGLFVKNINIGILLYSLFQIILVSLTFSYVLYFMAKNKVPILFRVLALLLFAFHPINVIYSVSLWKDVLFTSCFTIFTILIYKMTSEENYFSNKKNIILFSLISLLVLYLRNNGFYVVLITFIILFFTKRKNIKRLTVIMFSIIFVFFLSKTIILKTLNVKDYSVSEMLSFPSQSIARIYKYNYDGLSKKQIKSIEKFYSNKIGEVYIPTISDNTKGLLDVKYFNKHKKEYIELNFKLLIKYPKRYIESFISNSYGYYYVNAKYPTIQINTFDNYKIKHKVIINDLLLFMSIVLVGTIIMIIVLWNLNDKKNILLPLLLGPALLSFNLSKDNPIISLLFSIGLYVTLTFLLFLYNKKNRLNTYYYIPVIVLWISILFSPVFCEFRYLYPVFVLLPIYLGMTFKKS